MTIRYLAIPYSHPDPRVRDIRFEIANLVSASLMRKDEVVFSPITHSHPLVPYNLPSDWNYWKSQDVAFLNACNTISVVSIKGWDTSKGVREEMMHMLNRGIETEFIDPYYIWGTMFDLFVDDMWNKLCVKYAGHKDLQPIKTWREVV